MREKDGTTVRELLLHAAVVAVLVAMLFPGTVLRGEVAIASNMLYTVPPWNAHVPDGYEPVRNETTLESVTQFSAWYRVTQEAIRDGEWPLWNPYPFTGVPLLANYQSAVLYPPHLLTAWLDVPVAMTIYVLLKLWLCGMFAYVCARGLGLGLFAAQFASIGWMLGGYVQVWTYWAEVDVVAWLPLLLLSAEWLATGRLRRGFALMTVSASLMLIAGHPETALVVSVGVAAYMFIRMAQVRLNTGRVVLLASAAWACVLAVNAAQILPFLEYLVHSHTFSYRAVVEDTDYYVPSAAFLALFAPKFFGFTSDNNYWGERNSNFVHIAYIGVPVWLAIVALWRANKPAVLRARTIALAPPALLSLASAFEIPGLSLLHELPVLSSAWEIHALSFAAFGLPLLGAMGIEAWLRSPLPGRALWPVVACGVLVCVILWGAYVTYAPGFADDSLESYVRNQVLIATGIVVSTALILAGRRAYPRGATLFGAALVVVLTADLFRASAGMRPTTPLSSVFIETAVTDHLRAASEPIRVSATETDAAGNTYPNFGIEQLYGYDGIFPARIKRYMNELHPDAWDNAEPLLALSHYLHATGKLAPDARAGPIPFGDRH